MNHEGERGHDTGQLEGRYANYFQIGHNAFEFLLDFGQLYLESDGAYLHTRIITSPAHAKAFLAILGEALGQYERAFGAIRDS